MSLIQSTTRKGLFAACLFLAATAFSPLAQAQEEGQETENGGRESLMAPEETGTDMVDRIVFRDETTDQVLDLLERLTGRSIIRPQALPAATFTFNSQQPMTREEAILALESMLTINGIGVTPLGDLFLKVVPLARLRSESPEFLTESTLEMPASGRVVSRMLYLDFLGIDEIQTQLNLMITSGSGSIIPFPKANALLITDTVANLQAIEELLAEVDRPFSPNVTTRFFPIQYATATELVSQIETLAGTEGFPELSARTTVTADERSNQIIVVADKRQMEHFEDLIEKLDIQAELVTQNKVIFLKHADSVEVSSILSQLATGRSGGVGSGSSSRSSDSSSRLGGRSNRSGQQSGLNGSNRTNQRSNSRVPQIPGVRAQQATEGGAPLEAAESALNEVAATLGESDFSENLTILPDERTNSIIISGTKQDIALLSELIETIDIILAQVRIEVFIAEVSLSDDEARGIDQLSLGFTEGEGGLDFTVAGPGYTISRDGLEWNALFSAAATQSDVEILSTPTLVTTHNKEARFLVGETRPIITGTIASGSFNDDAIRSQVQQQDIAIELIVKPLIGNDGTIQLEIFQKVDDVGEETVDVDGNEQPVIIRREAESFVSVADGEIVILGGLQRTRKGSSQSRLGILGYLPIIGNLFTSSSESNERQELLVFIRPTVLPTTGAANEDAQKQISRQAREPYIRHQMEPDVYPDPDAPSHSEEARALREQSLRRQAEREESTGSETEPTTTETVPEGESASVGTESSREKPAEAAASTREGTGAGS